MSEQWRKSDLRKDFFSCLVALAAKDKEVMFLTGDLGFSFIDEYQKKFPKQFLNCGIAEQSMVSIAAGMALAGKKPFVYSGSVFLLARAYEQIRDDICYNQLNVKLIGTGAADFLGFSHNFQNLENENDLLKNLPNLKQFYPKNKKEIFSAMNYSNAAYIRL